MLHQLWYTLVSVEDAGLPTLHVRFYATAGGSEPVREWLLTLSRENRRLVGQDIKTAQYGWPLGMPLVRKIEPGLWEVRSDIAGDAARVLFTVEGPTMVLLHAFVKKTRKIPTYHLATARARLTSLRER